ncbi:hypothetical protein TYRP_012722 [Tyrophagus putrescentiae]|nr:hypothetical protein TYRP_012722 [Tyrophagus putrescentiae]
MFFFLVLVCGLAVVGCLFFGYHFVLQRRANSRRPHNVTVQFRRSSGITTTTTSSSSPASSSTVVDAISPRRRAANPRFEATSVSPQPRNGTTVPVVRNRNETRPSGVSFISPNSMYGYMPKANILNEIRKPERELKKEFTVRLAPFPHGLNRSLNNSLNGSSQNIHNNNNNNSTNSFMMNGGIAQQQQTTTSNEPHRPTPTVTGNNNNSSNTTAAPRPSNKRPIFSNDSSEDEATFKKLKNQILDDIDLDDSEMFDETAAPESAAPKKGAKRPTLPFENDLHLSNLSPLKRVKNNEILSSYSSTSASTESRSTLNKRKFQHSPEESANSNNGSSNSQTKVKKRTYIEELELLTSDQSPYYKNIYNTESSTSTTTTTPKRTTLPSLLPSKDQQNSNSAAPTINGGQRLNDQLATTTTTTTTSAINEPDVIDLIDDSEVDDDDDDDDDDISLNTDASVHPVADDNEDGDDDREEDGGGEIIELPKPPKPTEQVFSIKDHEYDKKKSKNRLNRFLEAVQQGSSSSGDSTTSTESPENLKLNSSSSTTPLLSSKLTNGTTGLGVTKAPGLIASSSSSSSSSSSTSLPVLPVPPTTTFNFGASTASNGIITFGAKLGATQPQPTTAPPPPPLTTTIERTVSSGPIVSRVNSPPAKRDVSSMFGTSTNTPAGGPVWSELPSSLLPGEHSLPKSDQSAGEWRGEEMKTA